MRETFKQISSCYDSSNQVQQPLNTLSYWFQTRREGGIKRKQQEYKIKNEIQQVFIDIHKVEQGGGG